MSDPSGAVPEADPPAPRTRLGWALASTVLCFLPLGLVALYEGLRTSQAIAAGRREDAARHSRRAKRWIIAAVAVGVVAWLVIAASLALLGAFSA